MTKKGTLEYLIDLRYVKIEQGLLPNQVLSDWITYVNFS